MSCDALVCAKLAGSGISSSNLLPLGPTSNDPLGSDLVVAIATVRNQFHSRLAVYAPATIASFGTGNARIDIRWVYPGGAKAYSVALPAALRVRKGADAQLLTNSNIRFSATARAQLLSGQVDPWLPDLIVIMAYRASVVHRGLPQPVAWRRTRQPPAVGGPGDERPGGAPHACGISRLDRSFIHTQRAEYQPVWVQQVTLRTGQAVLRIGYGAPSPLS